MQTMLMFWFNIVAYESSIDDALRILYGAWKYENKRVKIDIAC